MSWVERAACDGQDVNLFVPEPATAGVKAGADTALGMALCKECPVQTECWWDEITGGKDSWAIRAGQKPAELNAARKAFETGGDQRPEIEVKQKADQERADRLAARQAKNRESAARYARSLRDRAAAGDQNAVERLQARRQRTNGADQARRARLHEERLAAEREATLHHLEERQQEARRDEPVAEVA